MRLLRFLPVLFGVALGVAPPAQAGDGDRDRGRDRTQVKVIADELDNPRQLAFGDRGDLYVAEAGTGSGTPAPCLAGAEGPACFGATGAVTKIERWGHQYRIVSELASMANTPAGDSASGPHGITVVDDHVLITNGGPSAPMTMTTTPKPLTREDLADIDPVASLFGKVLFITRRGRAVPIADIWDFERDFNPDKAAGDAEVDSNPVDLLEDDGRLIVADAGGNALYTVDVYGRVRTLTVFPNRPALFGGGTIQMQAVPTSVVKGPDGQYYVSQLTGFPFPFEGARIYRVDPQTGVATILPEKFTNLMDLAFGRDGTLYALEIDADGLLDGSTDGAIFALSPTGGEPREIKLPAGTLPAPGGIAVGDDGLYVSINARSPGGGQVVRIRMR